MAALRRGMHKCPVDGKVHYSRGIYCSRKCLERQKILNGSNRLRMEKRTAAERGMELGEYKVWQMFQAERRAERAAVKLERQYERAELLAKQAEMAEEKRAEQRAKHNAYMLAKYYADPGNWSTKRKRRRIFEADDWRCRYCGKVVDESLPHGHPDKAVAMHINAKARGGGWSSQNMATGCHRCNVADGVNRLPIQLSIANL